MNIKSCIMALAILTTITAPAHAEWGAIAIGQTKNLDGKSFISAATAFKETKEEAEQAALSTCTDTDVPACKVEVIVNSGCIYVSIGKSKHDGGGTMWSTRTDASEAVSACESRGKGYNCQPAIGNCIN